MQSQTASNFMQQVEIYQDKNLSSFVHHFSPRPSVADQSCILFTITVENLLHFLQYFDDKVNSMKNFPLGFVEVRSTHLFFGFLNKCGKI